MSEYALLVAPSSNRVYAGEAPRLTGAELTVFGDTVLGAGLREVAPTELGGVPYVGFATESPLSPRDVAYLSNLSSGYALFAREGPELLRPLRLRPLARYDDDLVTIPKYQGKTNEQFTRLLLNVTVLASTRAAQMLDRRLVVLDPLCGRGTTLNQALMYGYDAIGVEGDERQVEAYATFLRTWLRRKRLKHSVELNPVRQHRQRVASRLDATLAPSQQAHRDGDIQRVTVLHTDTVRSRELLRAGCCDVIVTDAPYGIAHRSRSGGQPAGERSPLDLLAAAVPVWEQLLRRGGALGVAFNTHVAGRDEVAELLAGAGLAVVTDPAYRGFGHWVDQGITRDLLVAVKS
ncbi:MAG: SAM-dependent methyltransferase [Micromonosporaceae bacterium]|nr:SAM-dependent methyltransferase [Micromonosporaceae bacterium]